MCALLQSFFEDGDYLSGFDVELVCQFFVVGNEMSDVDIAVVLFTECIFADLISGGTLC